MRILMFVLLVLLSSPKTREEDKEGDDNSEDNPKNGIHALTVTPD
jgi:hypothetical protein